MKDLSMHIMDIIQNSVRAEASLVELDIVEDPPNDLYSMSISDDGCGMSPQMMERVTDPFFTTRTTRKVGLGLALLKQNAERTGGSMTISSEQGKGTIVKVLFSYSNIDRPVLGDIAGALVLMVSSNPDMDFVYSHVTPVGEYVFDTRDVKQVLEEVSVSDPQIMTYLKELIRENLKSLYKE